MVMDMDVLAESEPASRVNTPPLSNGPLGAVNEQEPEGGDSVDGQPAMVNGSVHGEGAAKPSTPSLVEEKTKQEAEQPRKMGNLMKELKQDVQQGGMEFNMDSFDF